jgi:hypothetical protein
MRTDHRRLRRLGCFRGEIPDDRCSADGGNDGTRQDICQDVTAIIGPIMFTPFHLETRPAATDTVKQLYWLGGVVRDRVKKAATASPVTAASTIVVASGYTGDI